MASSVTETHVSISLSKVRNRVRNKDELSAKPKRRMFRLNARLLLRHYGDIERELAAYLSSQAHSKKLG